MACDKSPVYHETQRKGYCLLHTLNNLFQERNAFTRASLNHIAKTLVLDDPLRKWWTPLAPMLRNPHYDRRNGNYDVNVLDAALRSKDKTMEWHDNRSIAPIDLEDDGLMGIVLNVKCQGDARHWIAVRRIGHFWYNLDSSVLFPSRFDYNYTVRQFLNQMILNGAHVLLVKN